MSPASQQQIRILITSIRNMGDRMVKRAAVVERLELAYDDVEAKIQALRSERDKLVADFNAQISKHEMKREAAARKLKTAQEELAESTRQFDEAVENMRQLLDSE